MMTMTEMRNDFAEWDQDAWKAQSDFWMLNIWSCDLWSLGATKWRPIAFRKWNAMDRWVSPEG